MAPTNSETPRPRSSSQHLGGPGPRGYNPPFKAVSHNLGGSSRLKVMDLLTRFKPDVLSLQENVLKTNELKEMVKRQGYEAECNFDESGKPGTAIIWRANLQVLAPPQPIETRTIQVLKVRDRRTSGNLTMVNVYAPSGSAGKGEREQLFKGALARTLRSSRGEGGRIMLMGDWNCVTKEVDVEKNYDQKKSDALANLEETFNLDDAYRSLHPLASAADFTFYRPSVSRSRLDRAYLSPKVRSELESMSHEPGLGDHAILVVSLAAPAPDPHQHTTGRAATASGSANLNPGRDCASLPSGTCTGENLNILNSSDAADQSPPQAARATWVLNRSIVEEEEFKDLFACLWDMLKEEKEEYADWPDWWEQRARPACRELCQRYSARRARERKMKKATLYMKLKDAYTKGAWTRVATLREEVRQMLRYEEEGIVLRSRCQGEAEEERASLYHMGRLIAKSGRVSEGKLKVKEGEEEVITDDESKIEEELHRFHDALFNARLDENLEVQELPNRAEPDLHQEEFLRDLPQVSQLSSARMESRLTEEEVKEALKGMQNGKSPGEDGLPKEFYAKLWDVVGPEMTQILQETMDRELLPASNTKGLTRLISKVAPQVPRVTELRPITRLNVDYKLLASCLAKRLRRVMPQVIQSRQLATPGKDIMEGAHNLLSTISYIDKKFKADGNTGGFVASYDMVKAFDLVDVAYTERVMKAMNFPNKFCAWFRMLHKGATTRLLLGNGKLSAPISLLTSLRQGCPLAMPAYVVQYEPFLRRLDQVLQGVTLKSPRQTDVLKAKGEAFCDDNGIASTSVEDLNIFDSTCRRYEECSGAKLSRNKKSKILYLGAWRDPARRPGLPVDYLQEKEVLKVFGFHVTAEYKSTKDQSWEARLKKLRGVLISWKDRDLPTLEQRVQVVNAYMSSTIWYTAQVLPLPASVCKQIDQELGRFIFRGRITMGRLKLEQLCHPVTKGGLGLFNTERKAKALFTKQTGRMLRRKGKGYKHISYWLGSSLANQITLHEEGPKTAQPPSGLHLQMKHCITEQLEKGDEEQILSSTAKMIYSNLSEDLPTPRFAQEETDEEVVKRVFGRLSSKVLNVHQRHAIFCLVNKLVRNKEHMSRVWNRGDPMCDHDPDETGECAGVEQTVTHLYQTCGRVSEAWNWLLAFITTVLGLPPASVSEEELLSMTYDVSHYFEKEVTWLLGNYYEYINKEAIGKDRVVKVAELSSVLRGRKGAYEMRRMPPVNLNL